MSRKSPAVVLLVVLLTVAALHASGLLGGRERLPLDGPTVLANARLPVGDVRTTAQSVAAALGSPEAAWDSLAGDVGRSRFRPLGSALLVLQHGLFGTAAATGIALVSLLLHALLAWLSGLLAAHVGAGRPATGTVRWAATLLVAVSPLAVPVASWPAQQPGVLAAVLGVAGTLLALRTSVTSLVGAGLLLAGAAACHELAFGWLAAALVLRSAAGRRGGLASAAALAAPVVVYAGWWAWMRFGASSGPAWVDTSATGGLADVLLLGTADGLLGAVVTLVDTVLPTHLRLADGPWTGTLLGRLAAVALFLVAVRASWTRRDRPGGACALAALALLTGLAAACWQGGAPAHATYGYIALPVLAAALAWMLAAAPEGASPEGTARTVGPARLALALLLVAGAAATAVRAPALANRGAFVALARRDGGTSAVPRSWALAERLFDLPAPAEERRRALSALLPDVEALSRDAAGELRARAGEVLSVIPPADGDAASATLRLRARAPLARDAVAATQVGEPLLFFAQTVRNAGFAPHDRALERAADAAAAAVSLLPLHSRAWTTLAAARQASGDLAGALDAATKAFLLDRSSEPAALVLGRLYVELGSPSLAVDLLEEFRDGALDRGDSLFAPFELLLATAYVGDGRRVVLRDGRIFHGYELAIVLAEKHLPDPRFQRGVVQTLHDAYLLYGDFLVEEDAPYLALQAYERGVELYPTVDGRRHLKWLKDRLDLDELDARTRVEAASEGNGSLGDALVAHAAALCHLGRFDQADAIFRRLSAGGNGPSPTLRFLIARHRYAWSPRPADLAEARQLLESALGEQPDLHPARLELARIEEKSARFPRALELYRQVSRQAFDRPAGVEAARHAERLGALLRR